MNRNSFEWFTVDDDGRHVVEGTSEPMFPRARRVASAVALITLLSRRDDTSVSEIVRSTINEICSRLFPARKHPRGKANRAALFPVNDLRGQLSARISKLVSSLCFYNVALPPPLSLFLSLYPLRTMQTTNFSRNRSSSFRLYTFDPIF